MIIIVMIISGLTLGFSSSSRFSHVRHPAGAWRACVGPTMATTLPDASDDGDGDGDDDLGDDELFFGPGDDFDPVSEAGVFLDPADPDSSEDVLITSAAAPPLRISRPSNDAVLEELIAQFRIEAMAEPVRFNQIMQTRIEQAVRQRPRTWYWSLVWPSAVALCRWMADDAGGVATLRDRRVLDLGAGIGVAGIGGVALAGARSVVLAEAEPRALAYAQHNAALNGVDGRVACRQLDWTLPLHNELVASFDAILLSDVLYDGDAPEAIARCAARALAPGGLVVLADQTDRPYDSAARRVSLCRSLDEASASAGDGSARWGVASTVDVDIEWAAAQHRVQIAVLSREGAAAK
jgi:predicted nicotinamide N-methyase